MTNKTKISLFVIIASIVLVKSLWELPVLLILGLILVACIKHFYAPIKKELLMFIVFAIIGTGGESLVMTSGTWSYTSTQLLNFPIWLPFLWGLSGITGVTIYESLTL